MKYANLVLALPTLPFLFPTLVLAQDVDVEAAVDREPPTITITNPEDDSIVSGIVNVTTSVADDAGIDKVEFYVDGFLKLTDSSAPYSFFWDTQNTGNGNHIIRAKVYDIVGKTAENSITVAVSNKAALTSLPPAIETPPTTEELRRSTLIQDPIGYLEQRGEKGLLFGITTDVFLGIIVGVQLAIILFLLYLLKNLRTHRQLRE